MTPRDTLPGFLAHYSASLVQEGDCLIWTGMTNDRGYGRVSIKHRKRPVHRVVYELARGPIPAGGEIDHTCFRRLCVNPSHLRVLDHKSNSRNKAGPPVTNKSGVRGVFWEARAKKWRGMVYIDGRQTSVGYFDDLDQAAAAVRAARQQECGDFAGRG